MAQLLRIPLNDLENSRRRLDLIMGCRRLSFNPYSVSDERLLDIVASAGWGGAYDITQVVMLRFTRMQSILKSSKQDGVFMKVGRSEEEVFLPAWRLKYGITASDTLHREYTMLGKRAIRNEFDINILEGKTVFVSHTIRGYSGIGNNNVALRMHRLKGKPSHDAALIRQSMCDAKIIMLNRILEHPECEHYLDCKPDLFDFQSRIRRAIELISHFHETVIRE